MPLGRPACLQHSASINGHGWITLDGLRMNALPQTGWRGQSSTSGIMPGEVDGGECRRHAKGWTHGACRCQGRRGVWYSRPFSMLLGAVRCGIPRLPKAALNGIRAFRQGFAVFASVASAQLIKYQRFRRSTNSHDPQQQPHEGSPRPEAGVCCHSVLYGLDPFSDFVGQRALALHFTVAGLYTSAKRPELPLTWRLHVVGQFLH